MKSDVIQKLRQYLKSSRTGVFLRREFNALGNYRQVSRALQKLLEGHELIKAGHGVYAKAALANNPDLLASRLYKKLGKRVDRQLQIGVTLLHMGKITSRANAHARLDLFRLLIARALLEHHSVSEIRNKSLQNLARWKANGVWNSGYEQWENLLLHATDEVIHEILSSDIEEPSNRLRQSAPYVGLLDNEVISEIRDLERDMTLLRIKREGQERSRQLVRDGKRSQESMFLIPREVARNSKVKWRGL